MRTRLGEGSLFKCHQAVARRPLCRPLAPAQAGVGLALEEELVSEGSHMPGSAPQMGTGSPGHGRHTVEKRHTISVDTHGMGTTQGPRCLLAQGLFPWGPPC